MERQEGWRHPCSPCWAVPSWGGASSACTRGSGPEEGPAAESTAQLWALDLPPVGTGIKKVRIFLPHYFSWQHLVGQLGHGESEAGT